MVLGFAVWMCTVVPATASTISVVSMSRLQLNTQTGNGASLTTDGFQFFSCLSATNPPFNVVELAYPGIGSPVALPRLPPPFPSSTSLYMYSSSLLATQDLIDRAFPFGTYQFNTYLSGIPSESASVMYTEDHYPAAQPYLMGTDYSARSVTTPG
jgi:hypothetical protein